MKFQITTKVGDNGRTKNFQGEWVQKSDPSILLMGELDYLVALIGEVYFHLNERGLKNKIFDPEFIENMFSDSDWLEYGQHVELLWPKNILSVLESVQTNVSLFMGTISNYQDSVDWKEETEKFEKMQSRLTNAIHFSMDHWIRYGHGGFLEMLVDKLGRYVRMIEAKLWAYNVERPLNLETIRYFNRLSDLLFVLARLINKLESR